MKKGWIVLIISFILILGIGSWVVKGLNTAVILDEKVNQCWAQVENQLQRRADLIPNLVNIVKGYMTHEKEVLTKITELRSQWRNAKTREEKIRAANQMEGVLSRLLLVVENYPQLKANENFLTLQAQLEGTENRIAVERMRYNQAVEKFNTYQRTVWGGFFTHLRGLDKPRPYFQAEKEAYKVPAVKF
ncbi:MAG: hypothetical protein B6D55_03890 [Candidatus Omnitrophica bacterium 4484_70.2]|nr:MAG: hypothetical protein B6D55_03890 [Candidatus Omnitrophica bacterium 4484_70.2]